MLDDPLLCQENRTMRRAILLAAVAAPVAACVAFAQQQAHVDAMPVSKVFVGQPLADATNALSSKNVEFHEGGFAFVQGDPDESNLVASIDGNHALACVWYSKSKAKVTRMAMVFRPHRRAPKSEQSWLAATELVLNEDRSYAVKFKAPLTADELRKLEANQPPPAYPVFSPQPAIAPPPAPDGPPPPLSTAPTQAWGKAAK